MHHPMATIKEHSRRKQLSSRVSHHEHEGWVKHVVRTVEGDNWQAVVLLLIVLDVVAVVVELLIGTKTLVFADEHTEHSVMHGLHIVSIGILVVFAVELFALLCALGKAFFSHFWFNLDLVVVYGALLLESGLVVNMDSDAGSLLVLLRAWRVVRVVHGFIELEEHQHEKAKELKELREEHSELHRAHKKKTRQHQHMSHRLHSVDKEWLDEQYPEDKEHVHGVSREAPV